MTNKTEREDVQRGEPNSQAVFHATYDADGNLATIDRHTPHDTLNDHNMMILDAVEQTYRNREIGLVRATIAAVLEAFGETELALDMNSQRTIWDRWVLKGEQMGDESQLMYYLTPKDAT